MFPLNLMPATMWYVFDDKDCHFQHDKNKHVPREQNVRGI